MDRASDARIEGLGNTQDFHATNGGHGSGAILARERAVGAGMAEAAFMAFLTSLCNKSFSATQFALLSSASTLAGRTLGASAGYVVAAGGWTTFFGAAMFMAVPALILLSLLPANTDPDPA